MNDFYFKKKSCMVLIMYESHSICSQIHMPYEMKTTNEKCNREPLGLYNKILLFKYLRGKLPIYFMSQNMSGLEVLSKTISNAQTINSNVKGTMCFQDVLFHNGTLFLNGILLHCLSSHANNAPLITECVMNL